ncbi:AmmeMemoRadiSam system protein B [Candidatus Woesearchaeota archaeon]|nr:AmmeMemoRadiSam system protein B [Candidatus Woesearchaeota archaeon]
MNSRNPAVAGLFYPAESHRLSATVESLLGDPSINVESIHGIVVPHAGYIYSGKTAGAAYSLLKGREFKQVVILGTNHTTPIFNADVDCSDSWNTPMGSVPVDPVVKELCKLKIFSCSTGAQEKEHSIEVQVPFLQSVLKDFSIIPIIVSDAPIKVHKEMAQVLLDRFPKALFVVSTDLSHYMTETEAHVKDSQTCKIFRDLKPEYIEDMDACGVYALRVVMYMCQFKGWKPRQVDYSTSGDVTGETDSVVGYCSFVF